jgi:putative salt-induced outer membrane protein
MKVTVFFASLLSALPLSAAFATDAPPPPPQGWSGSGEAGLAASSGNTRTENLNAKVSVKFNDGAWKNEFYAQALRSENTVTATVTDTGSNPPTQVSTTKYELTANRYEAGASAGYKLDERSYLVGAARYEHDQFSPYNDQSIGSLGYGYQLVKNASNEIAAEVGAGYKSLQPTSAASPSNPLHVSADAQSGAAARGKFEFKHSFNATTSFSDTYLVESTTGNTFVQNDAGLQVKMTHQLGLKAAYEVRHNSDVLAGFKNTDQLLTTNLVYSF